MLCMLYSLVVDTGCIWILIKMANLRAPGSFIHVFILKYDDAPSCCLSRSSVPGPLPWVCVVG